MRRFTLTEKLTFYFLMTGMFSIACVSWYSYWRGKTAIINRTYEQLTAIREIKKERIQQYFHESWQQLDKFANQTEMERLMSVLGKKDTIVLREVISDENKKTGESFFYRSLSVTPSFQSLYIACEPQRYIRFTLNPETKRISLAVQENNYPEDDAAAACLRNVLYSRISAVKSSSGGNLLFAKSYTGSHSLNYAGLLKRSMEPIIQLMVENNAEKGWGLSGESYLVDENYLMRTPSRFLKTSVLQTRVFTIGSQLAVAGKTGTDVIRDYRGIEVLSAYSPLEIEGFHWAILVEIDLAEAMAPVNALRNEILLLSILIAALVFILSFLFSRSISKPVMLLKQAADQISEGNFAVNLKGGYKDEFDDLNRAFNQMADRIRQQASARIEGQDAERQRLSMELHDGLGQLLVAAHYKLEAADCGGSPSAHSQINETKVLIDNILSEIRQISNNLMPGALREFGLVSAMSSFCREIQEYTPVSVHFQHEGAFDDLPADQNISVFRVFQESLNNIIKHAGSESADIQIRREGNDMQLIIRDYGKGMPPDAGIRGQGLRNIRERIQAMGGSLSITSRENFGTALNIIIPIKTSTYDTHHPGG
ncbi:MAG TPA: HAMP domain-containing protein [Bacteroidales bacterium]|nr:HAMP domain-containing protein [Bacteroidales bacterium]HSA42428.1 HAMP domain-containing protein [Bacteroidales bacterium]